MRKNTSSGAQLVGENGELAKAADRFERLVVDDAHAFRCVWCWIQRARVRRCGSLDRASSKVLSLKWADLLGNQRVDAVRSTRGWRTVGGKS